MRELRSENIDVINYTPNIQLYIQRALSPAKVSRIVVDELRKQASVYLRPDQISLAIGKGGQNVKLASKLTEYELDLFREADASDEAEEDVELDEFSDELEAGVIEAFKAIGCDTAKSVMRLTVDELQRRTELSAETIEQVLAIFRKEFED